MQKPPIHFDPDDIRIFSGNAHPELARAICHNLTWMLKSAGVMHGDATLKLGTANVGAFRDGEISVEIGESVRGKDVFVVQPTCPPNINTAIMELLIMLDALSRASAERITAVMPYYGYARQDRKVSPRAPISAKLIADLITAAGADRVLTVDLHAGQIQGFFKIPVDNLYATPDLCRDLESRGELIKGELVVVSPDAGGVRRARYLAHLLKENASLAIIDKRRSRPGQVASINIVGEVKDKIAILVDDMIDSAGTMCAASHALKEAGAARVLAVGTHPVFSDPAIENIIRSEIDLMLVTDTIPLKAEAIAAEKIEVVSIAEILAQAITNIHLGSSVSSLFTDVQVIN